MNQVGDTVNLMVAPAPSGSVIYSYVWDFWDGSTTATDKPFVAKVVNISGQPGTDELHYRVRPVAVDGQSVTLSGTITANAAPTILPGASVSNNGQFFAYATTLKVQAFVNDGDTFTFAWFSGTSFLGPGVSYPIGNVSGTWTGNDTTIIANYPATENQITAIIGNSQIITCYVIDSRGGTSSVAFGLTGEENPPPDATLTAGVGAVTFDSTTPPIARIGAGQNVDFTVYVAPMPDHTVSFLWTFSGSNGWTMPPATTAGVTTVLANGGWQNTVNRDISAEVVSSGTAKVATAEVRVTAVNTLNSEISYADAQFSITLIANSPPSSVAILRKVNGVTISGLGPVTAGQNIEFSAAGTDPNGDLMTYFWLFNQPFVPASLYLWGPKVVVDTGSYSGQVVQGQMWVYDRLGAQLTTLVPLTNVT
jgi:hypothetical protein